MKTKFSLTLTLIAALLTSCLQKEEYITFDGDSIPIDVAGHINQESTKVNTNGFEDGDALGIYAVNYTNKNQTPGTLLDNGNQVDHVKYILDEKNGKWNPVRPVYYKDVNTNIDLYAFYPHAEPTSVSAYNFEVQKDQNTAKKNNKLGGYEASDFLWGKSENIQPSETAIKVTLNHMMSGVRVVLAQGTGFEAGDFDLIGKSLMVKGTTRKASINLSNGEVSPIGEAQNTGIVMALQSDNSFRAIVVPQTVNAGTELFAITVDGITYTYKHSFDYKFQAGKLNEFQLTVNRKTLTGEYELILSDTQITDWKEDLNTHEGEARQYYCVHMTEHATLGKLIKENKKNPNKIKNLKISGVMSEKDFYFMRDSMDILEAVNLKEAKIVECHIPGEAYNYTKDDIIPANAFYRKKSLYYITLPEKVTEILDYAFTESSISGTIVIPDDVTNIGLGAFESTYITSAVFPPSLQRIEKNAFKGCKYLSGTIIFPDKLTYIGESAFQSCGLSGNLTLPDNLEYLGGGAFAYIQNLVGDLVIPEKIRTLYSYTFYNAGFTGTLNLNNVSTIGSECFSRCTFKGELNIPEGVTEIGDYTFYGNEFSHINFPSTLKIIGEKSFWECWRLLGDLTIPEGVVSIGKSAFDGCRNVESLTIPSTLQSIQAAAFKSCSNLNKITSKAVEPPTVLSDSFQYVAYNNFTVEVPENAVILYQADPVWGEFKRISAHYDFAISKSITRALNAEKTKTYILYAPANFSWSIESKPEWITVIPSQGIGKSEVTITFNEMSDPDLTSFSKELFHDEGYSIGYHTFKGRTGEIVFLLEEKDYRTKMTVEQYDYDYKDGDVVTLNTATKGNGVNIVFLGDCYDAMDISYGKYLKDLQEGINHYFAIEPYSTYKDYFNVYAVFGMSEDSGIGTASTIREAKFGSQYSLNGIAPDHETCYEYAAKAIPDIDPSKTLIVLVENTTEYGGICYMWYDGSTIACCPKSTDPYPYNFRGLIQHEAGGHGFGKLADEYIYHNSFISTCGCQCCGHYIELSIGKALGWFRNIEATGDMHQVGWSHLIFNPKYSNVVDMYEGGYYHSRGVYRSEPTSCMNNNIPYYSAISRQAIVERIMEYAGEEFTLDKFYASDSDAFGPTTKGVVDKYGILPSAGARTKQYAPVIVGDKPNFRRN